MTISETLKREFHVRRGGRKHCDLWFRVPLIVQNGLQRTAALSRVSQPIEEHPRQNHSIGEIGDFDCDGTARETERYEIVTTEAQFRSLQPAWNELHNPGSHHFTASFDWLFRNLTSEASPRGHRLHCVLKWRGGRLMLAWPFVVTRERLWTVARPLGQQASEYGLLVEGTALPEDIEKAWRLLRATCACDVIVLPCVRAESLLDRVLSDLHRRYDAASSAEACNAIGAGSVACAQKAAVDYRFCNSAWGRVFFLALASRRWFRSRARA